MPPRLVTTYSGRRKLPSTTALRAHALHSQRKRFLGAYGAEQLTVQRLAHQSPRGGYRSHGLAALTTTLAHTDIEAAAERIGARMARVMTLE